ncbi:2-succinyl-5-enolpyruvyl-6-hydroxy-3-cyclohexene-1-carboxylic-acid synthase [Nocardioides terrisoli]|uniref:2-succinyl-5-enolpyruvyl-6-hydroxy-3- cyclohexene-1-carboxylic-acid synthase n=1 Tax=Nocardioides terrisoli TaxID=3388267 RepID=UPI00287BB46F|nr:2-succinyl-5-enolpyruvyl-6-hydroxy-3-cyclohexene-1-carboxylic-acid synthase [Nocardioides marmorisolisilvae]
MNPSTALARWLVDALVDRGVAHAVLCPGSRNAPLSFALAAHPGITLHSRIDERTAGFLALGIAKTSRRPVAVVTTSGTATANLHPAVLEAAHAGLTLVAVTADRPAALRGTGSNQTTDQVRLYGDAAAFADLSEPDPDALSAAWLPGGPIHLNVQLNDPLLPPAPRETSQIVAETSHIAAESSQMEPSPTDPGRRDQPGRSGEREESEQARTGRLARGPRTVVVAGDDSGNRARLLAESAGWPLLAEPSSGSRNGATPIRSYRLLLGTPLAARIERAVVLGHPTLSRPVSRLLAREDVEVVSVRARGRWPQRPFPVAAEYDAVEVTPGDESSGWLEEWQSADRDLSRRIDALVADQPDLTPYDVAAEVNAAVPPGGLLYVGASSPIRDLDLMARPYRVGERRLVVANRGLAGIDGTLSSALGAVIGRPHTTRAIAYVGDVTFLHDLTGLVVGPDEQRPDLTVVVANDDGGSIFATLEQGASGYADRYDKLFGTPHGVDLAALCGGLRVPHWRVTDRAELAHALASPNGGIEVVEAVVRRDNRRELDEAIRALAG